MSECKFAVEAFHAYIESIGLHGSCGTLGELKAFKAGAEWQRSQGQAELAALKAKAAVPVQEPIGETCRAHQAGVIFYTWLPYPKDGTKLYAAPSQPQSDGVIVPRELLDRFPEINMANFGADEVKLLNDWGIEVSMLGGDHE